MNDYNEIYEKLKFFKDKNISIHVGLKNKRFYNGTIKEVSPDDFFILNDEILGELPLFFIEIDYVEPREAKK